MGGNIGTPILALEPPTASRFYVIELSSFQIELTPSLNPTVGVLLNITPDHLDRHGTMDRYASIKERVITGGQQVCVGMDDDYCRAIGTRAKRRRFVYMFSTEEDFNEGYHPSEGKIRFDMSPMYEDLADARQHEDAARTPQPPERAGRGRRDRGARRRAGAGLVEPVHEAGAGPAAAAVRDRRRVPPSHAAAGGQIQADARDCRRPPRRRCSRHSIRSRVSPTAWRTSAAPARFCSSTTARRPTRIPTEKALACWEARIHLILGGKPKEGGIASLAPLFPRIAKAYLIGASSDDFAATLEGKVPFERCGTLDVAVAACGARCRGERRARAGRAAVAGVRVLRPVQEFRGARRCVPRPRRQALPGVELEAAERLMLISRADRSHVHGLVVHVRPGAARRAAGARRHRHRAAAGGEPRRRDQEGAARATTSPSGMS